LSSKNGTISLSKQISISNLTNVIIEGPVTILNNGIVIAYSSNIMVRNLRILNAEIDGILVTHSSNVVIDHCTILDASRLSV
jgi:parallel beta-helix repeat protein